jgi:hypothetical protein
MIKYISKWYQDIVKTPRPDIEEASENLREALDNFNKAIAHLQSIEGVTLVIQANDYSDHRFYINSEAYKKFQLKIKYISESHQREF